MVKNHKFSAALTQYQWRDAAQRDQRRVELYSSLLINIIISMNVSNCFLNAYLVETITDNNMQNARSRDDFPLEICRLKFDEFVLIIFGRVGYCAHIFLNTDLVSKRSQLEMYLDINKTPKIYYNCLDNSEKTTEIEIAVKPFENNYYISHVKK